MTAVAKRAEERELLAKKEGEMCRRVADDALAKGEALWEQTWPFYMFVTFVCLTYLYVWHYSLGCVWCDLFVCVVWRVYVCVCVCDATWSCVWHDLIIYVTWLTYMCDMTDSYVWRDLLVCVTWLIHMCDVADLYGWRDWFICVTWLIHMCDMTYSYVWHDWFICVTWLLVLKSTRIAMNVHVNMYTNKMWAVCENTWSESVNVS